MAVRTVPTFSGRDTILWLSSSICALKLIMNSVRVVKLRSSSWDLRHALLSRSAWVIDRVTPEIPWTLSYGLGEVKFTFRTNFFSRSTTRRLLSSKSRLLQTA
jgi:hypothetical protein